MTATTLLFLALALAMAWLGAYVGLRSPGAPELHVGVTTAASPPVDDRAGAAEALRACIAQTKAEEEQRATVARHSADGADPLLRAMAAYHSRRLRSLADSAEHWRRQDDCYWHYQRDDD